MCAPAINHCSFNKFPEEKTTKLSTKRIYDAPSDEDGVRVLVDRLWPRGLSKEKAKVDFWSKEIAPSSELRKWYRHDPDKWVEFKCRYFRELDQNKDTVTELLKMINGKPATLLFGAKESEMNNAVALKIYLEKYKSAQN